MPFTIGFIGDWVGKGGDIVLAAHRRLRSEGATPRLLVVGSEPRLSEAETEELEIEWLPRQPRSALLHDIVPRMSVLAYPSRCDGVPLTLLEVMSAGVPPIVSNYRALPEVVDHGASGVVIPVDDVDRLTVALRNLLEPEERETLGAAARARILDRYTRTQTAPALTRVYREALASDTQRSSG